MPDYAINHAVVYTTVISELMQGALKMVTEWCRKKLWSKLCKKCACTFHQKKEIGRPKDTDSIQLN